MAVVVALVAAALAALPAVAAADHRNWSGRPVQKAFWGPAEVGGVSQFPIYRDLGVTLYQYAIRWSAVAPTRPARAADPGDPAYQWPEELDAVLAEARKYRMQVLIMILGAPEWANGGRSWEWAPERPRDYALFARAASRRYPGVRHWMVWGEPTRSANFKPLVRQEIGRPLNAEQRRAPRRYARILDAAYVQLKRQSRRNIVIGGNTFTTGDIRPLSWMRHMRLPNGRPPRMDLYGHNPFSARLPDLRNPPGPQQIVDMSDTGRLLRTVRRYVARPLKRRVGVFFSEFAVPTDGPDSEFTFWATRRAQARFISRAFAIARRYRDVYGFGYVHLYDEAPRADGALTSRSGLLDHKGRKKRGYYAFKRASRRRR